MLVSNPCGALCLFLTRSFEAVKYRDVDLWCFWRSPLKSLCCDLTWTLLEWTITDDEVFFVILALMLAFWRGLLKGFCRFKFYEMGTTSTKSDWTQANDLNDLNLNGRIRRLTRMLWSLFPSCAWYDHHDFAVDRRARQEPCITFPLPLIVTWTWIFGTLVVMQFMCVFGLLCSMV